MVFVNLFCVLLKKMKMKWNGKWINERNGNELKKKNKGNQIGLKLLSGVWGVGHLWLGGFRNKKKKNVKIEGKKEEKMEGQWAHAGEKKKLCHYLVDHLDSQTSSVLHGILKENSTRCEERFYGGWFCFQQSDW